MQKYDNCGPNPRTKVGISAGTHNEKESTTGHTVFILFPQDYIKHIPFYQFLCDIYLNICFGPATMLRSMDFYMLLVLFSKWVCYSQYNDSVLISPLFIRLRQVSGGIIQLVFLFIASGPQESLLGMMKRIVYYSEILDLEQNTTIRWIFVVTLREKACSVFDKSSPR